MSTKETIKGAAEKLFLTRGYGKTTMRMIATEADVPLGSIVYHYKTKDNLATIIYEEALDQIFGKDLLKGLTFNNPIEKLFMGNIMSEIKLIEDHQAFYDFFIELINEDVLPNEPHKYTMAMYREIIGYYDVKVSELQAYSYMLASKGVERIMYQKIEDNELHISRLEINRLIVATSLLHLGISKEIIDSAIDGCIADFSPEMMAVLK